MIDRRTFLKGLLSSVTAAAVLRNGVWRPERTVFDMAQNTWRGLVPIREKWVIDHYWSFKYDCSRLCARYYVPAYARKLIVEMVMDARCVDDRAVINALLEMSDEEARWAATHPWQVPVARLPCYEWAA